MLRENDAIVDNLTAGLSGLATPYWVYSTDGSLVHHRTITVASYVQGDRS